MKRRLPPDDIGEWYNAPVAVAFDTYHKQQDIMRWISEEITCDWYVRDHFVQVRGWEQLQKIFSFSDHSQGMMFALRWS